MLDTNLPTNSLSPSIFSQAIKKCTGKVSKQKGIAAVEFTLLLPLMLLFIAAIGEFGNVLIKYNTLSKAVQNGARIAVTEVYGTGNPENIADIGDISNAVFTLLYDSKDEIEEAQLKGAKVDVRKDEKLVIITASYPYQTLIAPLLDNIISQNFVLTSSSVMRVSP